MVIGVSDGDTLTLLDNSQTQRKVRLSGIDAPEKAQPHGEQSKQSLSAMVFGKTVTVEGGKTDRYGRTVGKVLVGGLDACLEQIKLGLAWHYKAYENEQPPVDRQAYGEAEKKAKASRLGLWQDAQPIPPWEWRTVK